MKIVIILSYNFPPNDGGIARMAEEIFGQFKKKGRDVRLITHEEIWEGKNSQIETVTRRRPLREWAAFQKIKNFDGTIISTGWYPEGLLANFSRANRKIVMAHGSELLPYPSFLKNQILSPLKKQVFESADLVIANSHFTKNLVLEFAPSARVEVIHPCVNPQKFRPIESSTFKSEKLTLSTVAVVQEHKGFDVVFEVIQKLPEGVRNNLRYLIAGNGPAVSGLKKLAAKKGIGDCVEWLGYVPENQLIEVYKASDLFLLCSKSMPERRHVEGFGMVLLEAMACEVPVIGTRSGGIPEAIRFGGGGRLIEEGDSDALADLILSFYDQKEKGFGTRKHILENCSWEAYFERLESALFEI